MFIVRSSKKILKEIPIASRVVIHLHSLAVHARRMLRLGFNSLRSELQLPGVSFRLFELEAQGLPTFFGYYDKTPFSQDNGKLLAMALSCNKDWLVESKRYPVMLGFFKWDEVLLGESVFHQFGESSTWSWQQGCMLQWFPQNGDDWVIYNRLVEAQYGAVIQDVCNGRIISTYRVPIYTIDPLGQKGVSLDFSRLERLRPGYGYSNLPDETIKYPCPERSGISLVELETGRQELLLSMYQVAHFSRARSMIGAHHYFNHLLFSPDGSKLAFLHLWLPNPKMRKNRLMVYDFQRESLKLIEDESIVSHFCWLSNEEILAFRTSDKESGRYCIYNLAQEHCDLPLVIHQPFMTPKDGHPSFSPGGDLIITDTYPDQYGDQHLYLYSLDKGLGIKVGEFFSPIRYRGQVRCDLHPRWDRTGKRVCIDSTYKKTRCMLVIEFEGLPWQGATCEGC